MQERRIVLLIGSSSECHEKARLALLSIAEVRCEESFGAAIAAAQGLRPHVVLVDLSIAPELGLRGTAELLRAVPGLPVVALATEKDPDLILRAMRAGAREFVVYTHAGELAAAVHELCQSGQPHAAAGTAIAVFAAKGGNGATAIATNLAGALRKADKRVVLLDADLRLGDVLVFLDMAATYTLSDAVAQLPRLDRELLTSSLACHKSGLQVLAQAHHLQESEPFSPGQLGELVRFLTRHYEYVVCDGLRRFDELSLAVLEASQRVLLIVTQDIPSIKNAQRCLEVLRLLGYDETRVEVVVNRYHPRDKIDLQSIADSLGWPVRAAVGNDYPTVMKAINRGMLLDEAAPRAAITADLAALAALLLGSGRKPRGGFFRSLFARNGAGGHAISGIANGTNGASHGTHGTHEQTALLEEEISE